MAIRRIASTIDVVTAARQRIKNVFRNGVPVYMSFSGGKDSIVLASLVYSLIQSGEIDPALLTVVFIDEEAIGGDFKMGKFLDTNGLLYFWSKIKTLVGGKVDKVEGMGLSANDFSSEEKTKLAGLENYTLPSATAETLGGVKVGAGLSISNGVLSASGGEAGSVDWDNIQNKPDIALKEDITTVYRYKGSKSAYAALPAEDNAVGDVWNVEDTGMNYAWTGTAWDALGQDFQIESITNAEIDSITED